MATASSVCNCIKTALGTPTCEECTRWLQPPIPHQHCGKKFKGRSVHAPSSCHSVPSHDCCGYFHLPSHCRYRHRGGLLMLGPQELTTTCPDAIVQLAILPSDEDENSMAFAVLPFAAPDDNEDAIVPSPRGSVLPGPWPWSDRKFFNCPSS
jgi:hypothetical protein